jgi:methyltransferase (TIGR00027 family)
MTNGHDTRTDTTDSTPSARQASRTAIGVATLRAVHQLFDGDPKILDDTIVVRLLGPEFIDGIRQHAARFDAREARGLRSHIVLRSRFAEDRLEAAAVQRGVRQLLVLGAGFDTFAYRQPAWARALRIFEVDQPASQGEKRARLAAGGIDVPSNVTFIAADFEHRSLRDILVDGGVDIGQPAFISWLGVTVYLTEPAIDAVFRFVASLPASSEIVFTFYSRPPEDEEGPVSALAARAAGLGEPFRTWFEPQALEARLRGVGFSDVSFLTPEQATVRYFPQPRPDHLPPPRRINTVSAIV